MRDKYTREDFVKFLAEKTESVFNNENNFFRICPLDYEILKNMSAESPTIREFCNLSIGEDSYDCKNCFYSYVNLDRALRRLIKTNSSNRSFSKKLIELILNRREIFIIGTDWEKEEEREEEKEKIRSARTFFSSMENKESDKIMYEIISKFARGEKCH
jgi:predicted CopG family antitoxin